MLEIMRFGRVKGHFAAIFEDFDRVYTLPKCDGGARDKFEVGGGPALVLTHDGTPLIIRSKSMGSDSRPCHA
jgi:hypothetical protein